MLYVYSLFPLRIVRSEMGFVWVIARRVSRMTHSVQKHRNVSHSHGPIEKILIANRGEIACRVIRTAKNLGIKTVAVYSEADRDALHVKQADEAVFIGPAPPRSSYLNSSSIIQAALGTHVHAIHPGYGFLSESAEFAELCEQQGLIYIGPPASAIRDMGDKSASKKIMSKAGVPVIPGYHGDQQEVDYLKEKAEEIGYPVLIKPTKGGGGKGMRIVQNSGEFIEALLGSRREANSSFGDETVLLEKYISRPRHIEVQIFGDKHGNTVHLYERDCSVQRRHQKIIEESPAPNITEELRHHLGEAGVSAAKAVGYYNAGTVEFIMDTLSDQFFFLEMNTRLQVEHPVTEMVTGQDLVEWQIRVANGGTLPLRQSQISQRGHAFEARIYAENVPKGFLPAAGLLSHYSPPPSTTTVRVETGVQEGDMVSVHYDPMIAKLVVWGENRASALVKLRDCLSDFQVAGLPSNISFLQDLACHSSFLSGNVETNFIENFKDDLLPVFDSDSIKVELAEAKLGAVLAAVCTCLSEQLQSHQLSKGTNNAASLWYGPTAYRINHVLKRLFDLKWKSERTDMGAIPLAPVVIYQKDGSFSLQIEEDNFPKMTIKQVAASKAQTFNLDVDGIIMKANLSVYSKDSTEHIHIWHSNKHHHFTRDVQFKYSADDIEGGEKKPMDKIRTKDSIVAPMAGCIVKILVKDGEVVKKDQPVLVLEAMKMEHVVKAPNEGQIQKIQVVLGQQVFDDSVLFSLKER